MLEAAPTSPAALSQPWRLPPRGVAVFHGEHNAPRLSHYFMPRLALEGKRILFLDGANCADPRLMARLAERRGMPFAQFNQQIMLARAFTCFQLTELISRVPQLLEQFPAQVVMITAFPELYFDEDVRLADATAAFQQALRQLAGGWGLETRGWGLGAGDWGKNETRNSKIENREAASGSANLFCRSAALPLPMADCRLSNDNCRSPMSSIENRQSTIANYQSPAPSPQHLAVALFSAASSFQPPAGRKRFFAQTCAVATELWKFQVDGQGRLGLLRQDKILGAGDCRWSIADFRLNSSATGNCQSPIGNRPSAMR